MDEYEDEDDTNRRVPEILKFRTFKAKLRKDEAPDQALQSDADRLHREW